MKETDRAYFAGIIDGEGCVRVGAAGGNFTLYVSVCMTGDDVVIKALHEAFPEGNLSGWARGDNPSAFMWQANGSHCRGILEAVLPYVKLKRRPVQLALEFVATVRGRGAQRPLTPEERQRKLKLACAIQTFVSNKGRLPRR